MLVESGKTGGGGGGALELAADAKEVTSVLLESLLQRDGGEGAVAPGGKPRRDSRET